MMVLDDVKLSHGSDSSSYALWPDWCPKWIRWVFILDPSVEFPTAVDVGSFQDQTYVGWILAGPHVRVDEFSWHVLLASVVWLLYFSVRAFYAPCT